MTVSTGKHYSPLSAADFSRMLDRYGFTECDSLRRFLVLVCDENPGACEMLYIWAKLNECLEIHDNGSAWFSELRNMKSTARSVLEHWQMELRADGGVCHSPFSFG